MIGGDSSNSTWPVAISTATSRQRANGAVVGHRRIVAGSADKDLPARQRFEFAAGVAQRHAVDRQALAFAVQREIGLRPASG